jgi:hypothetical protein
MSTFPLPQPENGIEIKEKIRKQTRQAYATEKEKLEKIIKHWSEKRFTQTDKALELAKKQTSKAITNIDELEKDVWYD